MGGSVVFILENEFEKCRRICYIEKKIGTMGVVKMRTAS